MTGDETTTTVTTDPEQADDSCGTHRTDCLVTTTTIGVPSSTPQVHQLAHTGPSTLAGALVLYAMALIILGCVLLRAARSAR